MICLFEDNKKSQTARLLLALYDDNYDFIKFTNGNGSIYRYAESYLNDEEVVYVFLDMVPGNVSITKIYWKLRRLSINNNFRLFVIPIICSEYYLIKSVLNFNNVIGVDKQCISLEVPYFLNPVFIDKIKGTELEDNCTSFEKYCKALLKLDSIKKCLCTDSEIAKGMFCLFTNQDCLCYKAYNDCKDNASVFDKSLEFAKCYPCIPSGNLVECAELLSTDDVWNLHRQLIDEFNRLVDIYSSKDVIHAEKYKYVDYIR